VIGLGNGGEGSPCLENIFWELDSQKVAKYKSVEMPEGSSEMDVISLWSVSCLKGRVQGCILIWNRDGWGGMGAWRPRDGVRGWVLGLSWACLSLAFPTCPSHTHVSVRRSHPPTRSTNSTHTCPSCDCLINPKPKMGKSEKSEIRIDSNASCLRFRTAFIGRALPR